MPNKLLPDTLKVPKHFAITHRESRFLAARIRGLNEHKALREAGFPEWMAHNPERLNTMPQLREILANYESKMAKHTLEEGLLTAIELHEQLTSEIRGDIAELYNPTDPTDPRYNPNIAAGDILPIPDWPLWARQGGVEVLDEPNMVHSDDEGGGSWDQKGRRIKIKMSNRLKSKELAAKLKTVAALVQEKTGDTHNHLHLQIVEALQDARLRETRMLEAPQTP